MLVLSFLYTAMQQVLDNLSDLPNSMGAGDLDLIFLRGLMESPIAHERLEETKLEAVRDNNLELVQEILKDITHIAQQDSTAAELARILQEPHFQLFGFDGHWHSRPFGVPLKLPILALVTPSSMCLFSQFLISADFAFPLFPLCSVTIIFPPFSQSLLETHDSVASKSYETPPPSPVLDPMFNNQPVPPDAVRMVGIRKTAGEHLGVTFRVERGELVIARILHGGMIDQQGLLHVGDIIKEVNGQEVGSDPRALQEVLKNASGSVVLKILPSYQEPHPPRQEAGLKFVAGDLLQIVNQDDPNWWQACHVEGGSAGLIPSQLLEEKRKAFVKRDLEVTPTSEFDRHELLIYEEVARMPPFRRKTLVLIGAQGVGRRSIKNKLIMSDQSQYGTTIPYTSRRPKEHEKTGQVYSFVTRSEMERDIKAGRYLEHGEYEGNLYGTKIDSIHEVVESGKMCILDVNPQAVKVLRTAEFVPYVVFIEAPDFETLRAMNKAALESGIATKQLTDADLKRTVDESCRIQRGYGHYFDLCLVNDNMERTFQQLQVALQKLYNESHKLFKYEFNLVNTELEEEWSRATQYPQCLARFATPDPLFCNSTIVR
ncbi:hypothetical protein E2320_002877 [Naja naja]|nr:hypothetical protein E2320_002877 [Naja naja]